MIFKLVQLILLQSLFLSTYITSATTSSGVFKYPEIRRDDQAIDEYHGLSFVDPYRWLENPDSVETKEFIENQNKLTQSYLEEYNDRDKIQSTLKELWNYPTYSAPFIFNNRYFYTENSGLQNQSVLYYKEGLHGEAKVLVDPNLISNVAAIKNYQPSDDGKYLAYSLAMSGSDWQTYYFMNVDTGVKNEDEKLSYIKYSSVSWTKDGKGLFYSRYTDIGSNSRNRDGTETTVAEKLKLFLHKLGTNPTDDIVIYELPEHPTRIFSPKVTKNGKYLILTISEGFNANSILYIEIPEQITGPLKFKPFFDKWDALYEYIGMSEDSRFLFQTNLNAPNYRIISFDIKTSQIYEVVPEDSKNTINSDGSTLIHGEKLIVPYIIDVKSLLKVYDLKSSQFTYKLPLCVGQVKTVNENPNQPEFFISFTSFTIPTRIYRFTYEYDNEGKEKDFKMETYKSVKFKGIDLDQIETKQIFYESKDKTKIPMYIVGKKGNTENVPVLLYGYGGFNVEVLPSFKLPKLVFIQNFNGIYALANIRGGGEYGKKWHDGGRLFNKQNVFDDFHMAAEFLIRENYTDSSKLTIQGGSNGGLLIGACVNQRPELYSCALPAVGVMDMLKFHKYTIGHAWISEYGSSDDKLQFENLLKFSPLHNIVLPKNPNVQYPAVLVSTADHDDRVVPLHSYKYTAELQYKIGQSSKQTNPLMITIEKDAGHGAGKSKDQEIQEQVNILCFIGKSLNLTFYTKK